MRTMAEWAEPRDRQVRWFGLLAATVVALASAWRGVMPPETGTTC